MPGEPDDFAKDPRACKYCEYFAKQLTAGHITFQEYAPNVTLSMVSVAPEELRSCVETIPGEFLIPFGEYLQEHLELVDFKPCPRPFMAGEKSDLAIEQKKGELRPRYIHLYSLVRERLKG